jgi:hypothetical protein
MSGFLDSTPRPGHETVDFDDRVRLAMTYCGICAKPIRVGQTYTKYTDSGSTLLAHRDCLTAELTRRNDWWTRTFFGVLALGCVGFLLALGVSA